LIVSIPHTGTGFLKKYFRLLGDDVHNVHIRETVAVKDYMEAYNKGESIVIPLRDPAENMLSHWHRGRHNERHHMDLAKDWRFIIESMPKACFVPLDNGADLDKRLWYLTRAAMSEGFGIPGGMYPWDKEIAEKYARDWKPLNVVEGGCLPRDEYRHGDWNMVKTIVEPIAQALETLQDTWAFWERQDYKQPFIWIN